MDEVATAALVLAGLWLTVLTVVVILLIRQVALLSARLSLSTGGFSLADDGPDIGAELASGVLRGLGADSNGSFNLLALSASCVPCREIAMELDDGSVEDSVVALITGEGELARALASYLPSRVSAVLDPEATSILQTLQIESRPFAVAVEGATIIRKSYIRGASDFLDFIAGRNEEPGSVTPGTLQEVADVSAR